LKEGKEETRSSQIAFLMIKWGRGKRSPISLTPRERGKNPLGLIILLQFHQKKKEDKGEIFYKRRKDLTLAIWESYCHRKSRIKSLH